MKGLVKSLLFKFYPIIIILVLNVIFGLILSDSKVMNEFGLYESPRCMYDRTYFIKENCEKCGSNIMESGVMYQLQETKYEYALDESTRREFKDYFSSYEEYYKDYSLVHTITYLDFFLIIILLSIYPARFIMLVYDKSKEKKSSAK